MPNKHSRASDALNPGSPHSGPEIDYSPKTYTAREKIAFAVKLFLIIGISALLLWLMS